MQKGEWGWKLYGRKYVFAYLNNQELVEQVLLVEKMWKYFDFLVKLLSNKSDSLKVKISFN